MPSRSPEDRSLTAGGLARLLSRLDADRDRAALEYERLHRALVRFFDWNGAAAPEDCADDTLDRLARRLERDVPIDSIRGYAHGIARLVLLEVRRSPATAALDDAPDVVSAPDVLAGDEQRACFDRCLDALSSDDRGVVLKYYEGERRARIRNRRLLAGSLGVTENALRIRVRRFRDRIERCVARCVAETQGTL